MSCSRGSNTLMMCVDRGSSAQIMSVIRQQKTSYAVIMHEKEVMVCLQREAHLTTELNGL